jgi:hypothetical protein
MLALEVLLRSRKDQEIRVQRDILLGSQGSQLLNRFNRDRCAEQVELEINPFMSGTISGPLRLGTNRVNGIKELPSDSRKADCIMFGDVFFTDEAREVGPESAFPEAQCKEASAHICWNNAVRCVHSNAVVTRLRFQGPLDSGASNDWLACTSR